MTTSVLVAYGEKCPSTSSFPTCQVKVLGLSKHFLLLLLLLLRPPCHLNRKLPIAAGPAKLQAPDRSGPDRSECQKICQRMSERTSQDRPERISENMSDETPISFPEIKPKDISDRAPVFAPDSTPERWAECVTKFERTSPSRQRRSSPNTLCFTASWPFRVLFPECFPCNRELQANKKQKTTQRRPGAPTSSSLRKHLVCLGAAGNSQAIQGCYSALL